MIYPSNLEQKNKFRKGQGIAEGGMYFSFGNELCR